MFTKRFALIVSCLLLPAALVAQDHKAALADELLTSMKVDKMIDQLLQQMPAMFQQQMQQLNMSGADKDKADKLMQDLTMYVREQLDWTKMKPEYVLIYSETFSEQELQGLVDFYKSPVGQAFIEKMPVVMSKTMQIQQGKMADVMAHVQEIIRNAQSQPSAPAAK